MALDLVNERISIQKLFVCSVWLQTFSLSIETIDTLYSKGITGHFSHKSNVYTINIHHVTIDAVKKEICVRRLIKP